MTSAGDDGIGSNRSFFDTCDIIAVPTQPKRRNHGRNHGRARTNALPVAGKSYLNRSVFIINTIMSLMYFGFGGSEFSAHGAVRYNILHKVLTPQEIQNVNTSLLDMTQHIYEYDKPLLQLPLRKRYNDDFITTDKERMVQKDFRRFAQNIWLSTACIEAIISYINQYELFFTHNEPRALILNMSDAQRNAFKINKVCYKVQTLFMIKNFGPKGTDGTHWYLYCATFNHNNKTYELKMYNSIHNRDNVAETKHAQQLFNNCFDVSYRMNSPVVRVPSPQQHNDDDCGVFALANAINLYLNPTQNLPAYTQNDINNYRRIFANRVLSERVVVLE